MPVGAADPSEYEIVGAPGANQRSVCDGEIARCGGDGGRGRVIAAGDVLFVSAKSTKNRREGPVKARSAWSCPSRLPINDLLRLTRAMDGFVQGPTQVAYNLWRWYPASFGRPPNIH